MDAAKLNKKRKSEQSRKEGVNLELQDIRRTYTVLSIGKTKEDGV